MDESDRWFRGDAVAAAAFKSGPKAALAAKDAAVGATSITKTGGAVSRGIADHLGDYLATADFSSLTSLPSGGTQLVLPGTHTVSADATIASKCLQFLGDASIVADGCVVTLSNLEHVVGGGNTVRFSATNGGSFVFELTKLGICNAYWFSGDDLGAKINNAFTWGARTVEIPAVSGQTISTVVQMVDSSAIFMRAANNNAYITAATGNKKAVFDCSGVNHCIIDGVQLNGSATDTPAVAFLLGRRSSGGNDFCRAIVRNTHVRGNWGAGICYNVAGETCYILDNEWFFTGYGDHPALTSPNRHGTLIISDRHSYGTDIAPASGALDTSYQSTSAIDVRGGQLNFTAVTDLTEGHSIVLAGLVEDTLIRPQYMNCTGLAHIAMFPNNASQSGSRKVRIDITGRVECNTASGCCPVIDLSRGAVATGTYSIKALHLSGDFRTQTATAGVPIVKVGQNCTLEGKFNDIFAINSYDTLLQAKLGSAVVQYTDIFDANGLKIDMNGDGTNFIKGCRWWMPATLAAGIVITGSKRQSTLFYKADDDNNLIMDLGASGTQTLIKSPLLTADPSTANPVSGMEYDFKASGGVIKKKIHDGTSFVTVAKQSKVQTATGSSFTPDLSKGSYFQYTLNANATINAATNAEANERVTFEIIQNGTGSFTVTWDSTYKVSWSNTGNSASKRSVIEFVVSSTTGPVVTQSGAQGPYV